MEAAVEHQALDDVARAVGPPDPAQHARAALAAAHEHEVARGGAGPVDRRARPGPKIGSATRKRPRFSSTATIGWSSRRLGRPHRGAHPSSRTSVSSATGSASSRLVSGSSAARTWADPLVEIVSPSGR